MKLLRFFFQESPAEALVMMAACIVAGLAEGGTILLLLHTFEQGNIRPSDVIALAGIIALFLAALTFYQTRAPKFAEDMLEHLTLNLCDRIRHAELPNIEQIGTAELYAQMGQIRVFTDASLKSLEFAHAAASLVIIGLYVWHRSLLLGLMMAGFGLLYLLVYELFQQIITPLIIDEQSHVTALFTALKHLLYGFKAIKLNRRKNDDLFERTLKPLISTIRAARIHSAMFMAEFARFNYFSLVGIVFLWTVTQRSVFHTTAHSALLLLYLWQPMMVFISVAPKLHEGHAAFRQLTRLREQMADWECVPLLSPTTPFTTVRTISVQAIKYTYPGPEGFTLGPVSFEIQAGELLFLAGGNGSGKSTLLKLFTGLYAPSGGHFEINGIPVDMRQHRELFSAVFSEVHLFESLYGLPDVAEREVNDLLRQFDLRHQTTFTQGGFSQLALSTGQRKRLALVVALLEDRPIYVFDEWAAEQDPQFRRMFYEHILPTLKSQGKTVLAVTHDDHYYHCADRVVTFEYGTVVT